MWIGLFQKKPNQVGWAKDMEFQRVWKKSMWKFQGFINIEVEFQSVFTKNSWVLVYDLEISKGSHTILQNFQG